MTRNENPDDGIWKEIGKEVHKDAERLFKMIGEAYAVLSDPTKVSIHSKLDCPFPEFVMVLDPGNLFLSL